MRILIASLPRAGSTMLFRAIAGLPHKKTTPTNPYCEFVRDLNQLPNKPFLKTHSPAPDKLPQDVRVIYIYGDPVKSVVSFRNKRWNISSWQKNNWFYEHEPDIINKDDLDFEKNFDSWLSIHNYPVLAIRYESLWSYQEILRKYLGFRFKIPKPQIRTTEVNDDLKEHLERIYSKLIYKMKKTPEIVYIKDNKTHAVKTSELPYTSTYNTIEIQKKRIFNLIYERYIRKIYK